MIRITTLLTFSFIFLCFGEYANAQYSAPGTRPHSGVPVASAPGTVPGYNPSGQATIPSYQGSAPGTRRAYQPANRPTYQAPGSIPRQTYAPSYTPAQRYAPAPQYAPRYIPSPVYVPSAPQYVPTPVYTQAPVYVPEPVYVPGSDYDAYRHEHRRWEAEHARWEQEHARDHGGMQYGNRAAEAQAHARSEEARTENAHADHGKHLGWYKNGRAGDGD
ncbi:MAG: hypothetical protein ACHQNE_01180 [Candidatus Kapaibacterium sp.]